MVSTISPWQIAIDRGPGWLFIRLRPPELSADADEGLAAQLWEAIEKHLTYRVVLEMDDVTHVSRELVGQLVMLQERIHKHDGVLRLCRLPRPCQETLRRSRQGAEFHNYPDRKEAVLGCVANQPR